MSVFAPPLILCALAFAGLASTTARPGSRVELFAGLLLVAALALLGALLRLPL